MENYFNKMAIPQIFNIQWKETDPMDKKEAWIKLVEEKSACADADLIIECVKEDMATK